MKVKEGDFDLTAYFYFVLYQIISPKPKLITFTIQNVPHHCIPQQLLLMLQTPILAHEDFPFNPIYLDSLFSITVWELPTELMRSLPPDSARLWC